MAEVEKGHCKQREEKKKACFTEPLRVLANELPRSKEGAAACIEITAYVSSFTDTMEAITRTAAIPASSLPLIMATASSARSLRSSSSRCCSCAPSARVRAGHHRSAFGVWRGRLDCTHALPRDRARPLALPSTVLVLLPYSTVD